LVKVVDTGVAAEEGLIDPDAITAKIVVANTPRDALFIELGDSVNFNLSTVWSLTFI
jgi:hypothetical protein